jgi:hypothetical protein
MLSDRNEVQGVETSAVAFAWSATGPSAADNTAQISIRLVGPRSGEGLDLNPAEPDLRVLNLDSDLATR